MLRIVIPGSRVTDGTFDHAVALGFLGMGRRQEDG
jgi:hypothetical protein